MNIQMGIINYLFLCTVVLSTQLNNSSGDHSRKFFIFLISLSICHVMQKKSLNNIFLHVGEHE